MADEKHSVNDLVQIRELIFGEKIREYERRFSALEEKLAEFQASLNSQNEKMENLKADLQQNTKETNAQISEAIESLRKELLQKIEELANDKTDRLQIGNYLIELGMRLKGENVMDQLLEQDTGDEKR